MNVTRLAGWILLLFAVFYAVVTLMDYGPEYAAAGFIGEKAEDFGLKTTATNLRFAMGWEFFIDVIIIAFLGLIGWWLTTQEVPQYAWIAGMGLFVIFSIVIRVSPVLPMNIGKLSPGAAFWGAKTQVVVAGFPETGLVPVTRKTTIHPVLVTTDGQTTQLICIDLSDPVGGQQYSSQQAPPVTVVGALEGTSTLAHGNALTTVPLLKVKTAVAGVPPPK
jgi:hypothetical protein